MFEGKRGVPFTHISPTAALDYSLPVAVHTKPTFWTFAFYKSRGSEANCGYIRMTILVVFKNMQTVVIILGVASPGILLVKKYRTRIGKEKCCWGLHFKLEQEEYCPWLRRWMWGKHVIPWRYGSDMGNLQSEWEWEQTGSLIWEPIRPFKWRIKSRRTERRWASL